jgi:GT2 family glycosyltransferase
VKPRRRREPIALPTSVRSSAVAAESLGDFDCAVVVPAAGCVCRQVEAVRPQLRDTDCLVVVWNGPRPASHDCSGAVLRGGAAVWIEFPTRLGAATARNRGVQWLNGRARILAFVDSDDLAHHDWLSELRERLTSGVCELVGGVLELGSQESVHRVEPGLDFWYRQAVFGSNCAVTREGWERLGGFSPGVGTCEDTDLAWRAGEMGLRISIVPTAVVRYSLRRGWAEWQQRVTWGRSSVALLRAHGLPLSRHLPDLQGLIRHKRSNGFASSPLVAGLGQFAGQWVGRLCSRRVSAKEKQSRNVHTAE